MLRPTLAEILMGIQRTVTQTFLPELSSPYAQSQASTTAGVLAYVAFSLDGARSYDDAEIADLEAMVAALSKFADQGAVESEELRAALASAAGGDRRAREAALSKFTVALALGKLGEPVAAEMRAWMRRHLDRMRALLLPGTGARG